MFFLVQLVNLNKIYKINVENSKLWKNNKLNIYRHFEFFLEFWIIELVKQCDGPFLYLKCKEVDLVLNWRFLLREWRWKSFYNLFPPSGMPARFWSSLRSTWSGPGGTSGSPVCLQWWDRGALHCHAVISACWSLVLALLHIFLSHQGQIWHW